MSDAARTDIDLTLLDIVSVEGPVLGTRLHSSYVAASGGRRVGHVIADQLDAALRRLVRNEKLVSYDARGQGIRNRTFRLPTQAEVLPRELGPRDLDDVPPRELAVVLAIASRRVGWENEALFREALHMLGRSRLTTQVQRTLAGVLPMAREVAGLGWQKTTS